MILKIAQYRAKEAAAQEVRQAVKTFVAAVLENEPQTKYEAYLKEDGVSYIHYMVFTDEAAQLNHEEALYTQDFVQTLYPRCVEPPVFNELTQVA